MNSYIVMLEKAVDSGSVIGGVSVVVVELDPELLFLTT